MSKEELERLEAIRQAYIRETNVSGFWRSSVGQLLVMLGANVDRQRPE